MVQETSGYELLLNVAIKGTDSYPLEFGVKWITPFNPFFGSVQTKDQKLLMMKFEDNILFTEKYRNDKHIHLTMDDTLLTEVKKCLAFQWLLGLPIRKDRILLRTFPYVSPDVPKEIIFPMTCNERYIYSPKDIPLEPRMIKMWFGDTESFYKIILDMIEGRSIPEISSDIRDIILRYAPEHIGWKESILNQLNIVRSHFRKYITC